MKTQAGLIGGLLAVGLLSAGTANADLVFYGSHDSAPSGPSITYFSEDDRGELECSGCQGLITDFGEGYPGGLVTTSDNPGVDEAEAGTWSASEADVFVLANDGAATELAFVNGVTGESFVSGTTTDTGGASSYGFTSSALYILFKIGNSPDVALIWNNTGGAITYTWNANAGEGAGLSHITEFGGTVSVPEPHTSLLLGAGLLAMAFTWRRKKAKA